MKANEWLNVLMWACIAWVAYSHLTKKKNGRLVAHGAAKNGAPAWLRQFAIAPSTVVNVQRIDEDVRLLKESKPQVRELAARCWEEGRCRSLEFARFMAGEPLAIGMRLYFVHLRDGEKEPSCYAFVAPERW